MQTDRKRNRKTRVETRKIRIEKERKKYACKGEKIKGRKKIERRAVQHNNSVVRKRTKKKVTVQKIKGEIERERKRKEDRKKDERERNKEKGKERKSYNQSLFCSCSGPFKLTICSTK